MERLPMLIPGVALFVLLVSCATVEPGSGRGDDTLIRFRLAHESPVPASQPMETISSGARYYIAEENVMDDGDIAAAGVTKTTDGLQLMIRLTDAGAARLRAVTEAHSGERLALLVGGRLVNAPVIRSPLTQSGIEARIVLSEDEAVAMAADIEARFSPLQ